MGMRRFSEILCPLCKKRFGAREGKPRTLKQWRVSLIIHLTASLNHHLTVEQAESAIDKYLSLWKVSR